MKVMLIDDEPFALKLLAQQLTNLGVTDISQYQDANDGLVQLQQKPDAVQLIFCDLQMPGMDGVEFVRNLGETSYAGGLMLVSGEDARTLQAAQRLATAFQLDVVGCLTKPASVEQLRQLLDGRLPQATPVARSQRPVYSPDELQRAIAGGELVAYFEPKVTLATGAVSEVETLVRWQHPQDGLVYPDQFIGMAEQNGLIDALTDAVMFSALRQAGLWQKAGIDLQVAVNVSMNTLTLLDFPERVMGLIEQAGVTPACLMLEITESQVPDNARAALEILTRLRLKRIGLSIDDFGTGHSSLAQLRDLPFDELKIDRGFVHGACRDASLRAIYETSLTMAQRLGMKAVAEGVEDQADWDFVRASGCDRAQGWFIARAMPAANLIAWLDTWEERRKELYASAM